MPKPILLDPTTQSPMPEDTTVECRASCGRDGNWSWERHIMCHEKAVVCWKAKNKAGTIWFFCAKHGQMILKGQHTVRERFKIELDPKPGAEAANAAAPTSSKAAAPLTETKPANAPANDPPIPAPNDQGK
jgi:hypothetical protein